MEQAHYFLLDTAIEWRFKCIFAIEGELQR